MNSKEIVKKKREKKRKRKNRKVSGINLFEHELRKDSTHITNQKIKVTRVQLVQKIRE